jgi:hypothetical protein
MTSRWPVTGFGSLGFLIRLRTRRAPLSGQSRLQPQQLGWHSVGSLFLHPHELPIRVLHRPDADTVQIGDQVGLESIRAVLAPWPNWPFFPAPLNSAAERTPFPQNPTDRSTAPRHPTYHFPNACCVWCLLAPLHHGGVSVTEEASSRRSGHWRNTKRTSTSVVWSLLAPPPWRLFARIAVIPWSLVAHPNS